MRVFSVEMLVKEEGAAVVEAALKRLKGEAAAVAAEMKVTTSEVAKTGTAMKAAGAGTEIAKDKAAKAAIGFAAVGQSIARTGSLTADAGTRIIEAGSQIATMFGPGGLVASALLAAAAGIATYFFNAKKEIADTKKKLDELTDVGNLQGLQDELDKLVLGTASQRGRDAITAQAAELSKLEAQYGYVAQKLSSELTPAERDAREKMRELREEITKKRDAIADLQNRLKLGADAQRYHTTVVDAAKSATDSAAEADRNAAAALKELNEQLALTNVNRKELIYGIRETSREMDANARSVRAAAAAYQSRLSQRIQTELKAAPLQSADIERIARDAQAATERYRLQNAVQMDLDVTIGDITSGGIDIDQKLLDAIRADDIKTTLADGIGSAVEGGLMSGLEMAMSGGNIGDSFKAMGQAIVRAMASAMVRVATEAIKLGTLLDRIREFMILHPKTAVITAIALLTLARSMGGSATSSSMAATGGAGGLSYAPSGSPSTLPTQQIIFGATSATTAAGMTPRSATNVTIIGPNDPSAQRAMQELMAKADSRGRLG